jgi:hypothetical protein
MKEIRDIKIDLVMGNKNPIVDLFCNITSGIEIINCNVYNEDGLEFIYHKDGQWIFYQDCKNEKFWTHYYRYWEILEKEFSLEYEEIGAITKLLVDETLKREVTTSKLDLSYSGLRVEEALKREVTAPESGFLISSYLVDEALKREVTTPVSFKWMNTKKLEEVLKREVATPTSGVFGEIAMVEEVLKRVVNTPLVSYVVHNIQVEEALKRKVVQR